MRRASQELLSEDVHHRGRPDEDTDEGEAGGQARSLDPRRFATVIFKAKERLRVFSNLRITPTITIDPNDRSTSFSFSAAHADEDIDATLERFSSLPAQLALKRAEGRTVLRRVPRIPASTRSFPPHASGVPGATRCGARLLREQAPNDASPLQRREQALLQERRVVEIGAIDVEKFAAFVRERFDATEGASTTVSSKSFSRSRAGIPTRLRSWLTHSGKRYRRVSSPRRGICGPRWTPCFELRTPT